MIAPGTNGKPADPAVEAEVDRLKTMPIAQLRVRYREVFRTNPPKAFGPDLLRRSIAYRIQERAYGGISRETRRLLDQMIKAYWANPTARLEVPRRIKPGSELVRTWKGAVHRVTVLADGYAYQGETYKSLSEIAVLITGTRWNGPRFFGLRPSAKSAPPDETEGVAPPARKRGRPPKIAASTSDPVVPPGRPAPDGQLGGRGGQVSGMPRRGANHAK